MASISLQSPTSGRLFIGNPIIYRVTPGSTPSGAVFHKVVLIVTTTFNSVTNSFEFSLPVTGGAAIDIDISSALRAATAKWEPTATSIGSYPLITFSIASREDYVSGGTLTKGTQTTNISGQTAQMGALNDYERTTGKRPSKYTRKPNTSPEIVHSGKAVLYQSALSTAPATTEAGSESAAISNTGCYFIPSPPDSYEMRFFNSLGVIESVHVTALRTSEVKMETERYAITKEQTVTDLSRAIVIKRNNHERWRMSSGPIDEAWAKWFAHEFLIAKWAWIKINDNSSGQWVACHILPEDTTSLVNRKDNNTIEVSFTIEFDINGGPMPNTVFQS